MELVVDGAASESKGESDLALKELLITDAKTLLQSIDAIFALGGEWLEKKAKLHRVLQLVDLSTTEGNKYTFFDVEKPYTRNLIAGCIKETRFEVCTSTNSINQTATRFYCEGQVSFMDDYIGLHKIGNPSNSTGAITLHLYTPPFSVCKVWSNGGEGQYLNHEEGKVGYFSVFGHRSPHLEGKPGLHAKLMDEIRKPLSDEGDSGV
eukprot:gene25187-33710_t